MFVYSIDPLWASWFSGFVDGEGYFQILWQKHAQVYAAHLSIVLREDDQAIIEEIYCTLKCGVIHRVSKKGDRRVGKRSSDQFLWRCRKIDEVVDIVIPLLNHFPLKTKKRFDYFVWKEAALTISKAVIGQLLAKCICIILKSSQAC